VKSTFGVVSVFGIALVVVACSSDNTGFNPRTAKGPDQTCVAGELTVGLTVMGDLSKAGSCAHAMFYDSTQNAIAVSYNLGTQAGKGYLVSLQSNWANQTSLIGTVSGVPATLAYADYGGPWQATLAFVATSNAGYSVRVGAYDSVSADTGAYALRTQTCKVPVPTITDAITHSDHLAPGDCVVPQGDFASDDSSYVHLYAIQFDAGETRTITFTAADSSLSFDIGGPGFDPYGYFCCSYGGVWSYGHWIQSATYTVTAAGAGIYTLIVGTSHYAPTSQPYTLTVSAESVAASRVPPETPSVSRSDKMLRLRRR
jgi:hypothetical protein